MTRPKCSYCDNEALYACTYYDWDYTECNMGEITWEVPHCISCAIKCGFDLIRKDVLIIEMPC